ncbi:MAG: DUF6434 domain-containing protein [Bacteroidota bacterium]
MGRPDFIDIHSGEEFARWYWKKEELLDICKASGLPMQGSKFELQDRIKYALDNDGAILLPKKKPKLTSRFNWAHESLSLDTLITDNISFGPNVRGFLQSQIGPKFVCHTDFMDWVKAHPGKTLHDAIDMWWQLEERKKDPNFKREIAAHNMMNQYFRDFMEDNPERPIADARACWKLKKQLPTKNNQVVYESSDLALID